MKRRIIKQGHNTLTITLPSEWVKRFNLQPGDEIDLIERENGLFLGAQKNNESRKTSFDIDDLDIPTIWKYIMAVYREGYDEVLIKFSPNLKLENPYKFFAQHKLDIRYNKESEKTQVLEFFHSVMNRFIGFEIVDHGKDFVLIKELSEPTPKEFDNALRRIFLLTNQMAEETCEALKKNKPEMLSHIHDVDINLDKFHDYCIRILNKINYKEPRKESLLFTTLYLMELMGDEFKNISHHLIHDFKNAEFKNIQGIAESIKEQILDFYSLFYTFDKEKIRKISEIDQERYFNVIKVYKKTEKKEEKEIFHHLRIIARYINALLELRIELEF
ncbi:phosphate uptake regulator PhoU [Candidatus Woesearchaeota archaeon]|nr:phosphate uptake regulator PhoU [Candidatus Woesearchaeota archaeon]